MPDSIYMSRWMPLLLVGSWGTIAQACMAHRLVYMLVVMAVSGLRYMAGSSVLQS